MLDVYSNRLSVSLAAGASVTLAHGIINEDLPAAPNQVLPDRATPIYVAAVTSTTITFTNGGSSAATAVFQAQYVFSTQASSAQMGAGMLWQGDGGIGGSGSGQILSYVFRPNEPAPGNGVYADWALLYADLNAAAVQDQARVVLFDGSLGDCDIPAGVYDFTNIAFQGVVKGANFQVPVTFLDGASAADDCWPTSCTNVAIRSQSTAPVCTFTAETRLSFIDSGIVNLALSAPIFYLDATSIHVTYDGNQAVASNNRIGEMAFGFNAGALYITLLNNAEIADGAFDGAVGTVTGEYNPSVAKISTTHASFGGTATWTPIGSYEPCTHKAEAIVDTTVTTNSQVRRAYSTIAAALADGFTVLRLREGQAHAWDGTGYTANGATVYGNGTALAWSGGLLAGPGTLTFQGLNITTTGNIVDAGANHLIINQCRVSSLTGHILTAFAGVWAANSQFIGTRFNMAGGGALSLALRDCAWSPGAGYPAAATYVIGLDGAVIHNLTDCVFDLTGIAEWGFVRRQASTPALVIGGCRIAVANTSAGAPATLFANGAATMAVTFEATHINRTGGNTVNIGAGGYVPSTPAGLIWQGNIDDAPPTGTWYAPAGVFTVAP